MAELEFGIIDQGGQRVPVGGGDVVAEGLVDLAAHRAGGVAQDVAQPLVFAVDIADIVLGSFEQIELMQQLIKDFGGGSTRVIVDPCMGDNGSLYSGFTPDFAKAMAGLCSKADVIVPNLTEASYMLGIPYVAEGYTKEYIEDLLRKLSGLGARRIVLKGVSFDEKKLGIASYDSENEKITWYFHEKMPQSFHGTGDIFASVLTGALVRGKTLDEACRLAADFVVEAIRATLSHKDYNWYGVDFESAIPFLISQLSGN